MLTAIIITVYSVGILAVIGSSVYKYYMRKN